MAAGILVVVIIALLGISLFGFGRDVLSPTFLLCSGYFLSGSFAFFYRKEWEFKLHLNTAFIIIMCLLIALFLEVIIRSIFKVKKLKVRKVRKNNSGIVYLRIPYYWPILFSLLSVFVFYLYYKEILRLVGSAQGWNDLLYKFRLILTFTLKSQETDLKIYISLLFKIVNASAFVFLYIFINNLICEGKILHNIIYFFPCILFIALSMISTGRMYIIQLTVSGFFLSFYLQSKKNGNKNPIKFKTFIIVIFCSIAFLYSFTAVRSLTGRQNSKTPLDYIAYYAGGSIAEFDLYMQDPLEKSKYIGHETFYNIYNNLRKIGLTDFNGIGHLEFRKSGSMVTNIYTANRCCIQDFGLIGWFLLQLFFFAFFEIYYIYLKNSKYLNSSLVMTYAFLVYAIPLHSVLDVFFHNIGFGWFVQILFMVIIWRIVQRVRFKKLVFCIRNTNNKRWIN